MASSQRTVTIPQIMFIAGTRVAVGVGLGLLIADLLSEGQRRWAGWGLLAFGVLTSIPIAKNVLAKPSAPRSQALKGKS